MAAHEKYTRMIRRERYGNSLHIKTLFGMTYG